ncbi:MAG: hypothetical protein IBJ03_16150 [Gemmatimonadaceae bacterium]|nr:hypothetical protein [Gemmatimonadaceae bacterium]
MPTRLRSNMAALVIAGCTALMTGASLRAQSAPRSASRVLEFTAMDFAFRSPAKGTAGLNTIRLTNTGKKLHHVQLFKLEDGKRLADLFPILNANKGVHNTPKWAVAAGGVSAALPGQSIAIRQQLAPGRYAVICWVPSGDGQVHVMKGMMSELEITPSPTAPREVEPASDIRVTLKEYAATFSTPLTRGKHTLRIENVGAQDHEFLLVKLKPGKTPADVGHWAETGQITPSPVETWSGLAGIASRGVAWLDVDLTPGTYAVVCFSPDRRDGKPHSLHGFSHVVRVP